ncbi:MAG: hypothetical protein ACP5I8_03980 [Phycisphaerae bacterium]
MRTASYSQINRCIAMRGLVPPRQADGFMDGLRGLCHGAGDKRMAQ